MGELAGKLAGDPAGKRPIRQAGYNYPVRRFAELYTELQQAARTSEKVAALARYFRAVPPCDAAWALFFLTGRRLPRVTPAARLRAWLAAEIDLPNWLIEQSFDAVGDPSEAFALLLPHQPAPRAVALHELVEQRLAPLRQATEARQRALFVQTWRELSRAQVFLFHKLSAGVFRAGVPRALVLQALAGVTGVAPAILSHRLLRGWAPTAADYLRLTAPDASNHDPPQPYPFCRALALPGRPDALGPISEWLVEWKWDGIRAQLIRRGRDALLWSRGGEWLTDRFPELRRASAGLPAGTVLDGEILAWEAERPRPLVQLQRRLQRKPEQERFWMEVPVVFMACDLLEDGGVDLRSCPLHDRRRRLQDRLAAQPASELLRLSPLLPAATWAALDEHHAGVRALGVRGLMLKRRAAPYSAGRARGDWWIWKLAPLRIRAVLTSAQRGSGPRASLYTVYRFAVWDAGQLVPVAQADAKLSPDQIRAIDQFVRNNTLGRRGPLRSIRPELVFELAFEQVQSSSRHRARLVLWRPHIVRWRTGQRPEDADHLETLRALLPESR